MIKAEESKQIFDTLISNCTLQPNGSYESTEGRVIWTSNETYKIANSSTISKIKTRTKSKIMTKSKSKKKK